jgi:hypothetical protein
MQGSTVIVLGGGIGCKPQHTHTADLCCVRSGAAALADVQAINLGTFATEEEAARVWNEAALLFRGGSRSR